MKNLFFLKTVFALLLSSHFASATDLPEKSSDSADVTQDNPVDEGAFDTEQDSIENNDDEYQEDPVVEESRIDSDISSLSENTESNVAEPDFIDMSLEDLLEVDVTVATGSKARSVVRSPGIVTVISAEDIARSGAQDLVDVLRMVPGISIEYDMGGLLGIGMRGIYATEGKMLFLIDGIEINEDIYGAFNPGHRIPAALIDRVEIIRGPGSAVYGGYAELGVISIHTKKATTTNRVIIHGGTSIMFDEHKAPVGRALGTMYYGGSRDRVKFSLSASGDFGHMTNQSAADIWGEHWNAMDDQVSSLFINGNLQVMGLDVNVLVNRYSMSYQYPSYELSKYRTEHNFFIADAKYTFQVTPKVTLIPQLQYKNQQPWYSPRIYYDSGDRFEDWEYDLSVQKLTGALHGNFQILNTLGVSSGIVYDFIYGADRLDNEYFNGENSVQYSNIAVYLQGMLETRIMDVAMGGRFNYHQQSGMSLVPRLALTRDFFNKFHIKFLAAIAYKAPTLANLGVNPDIKPEKTPTLEFEWGARWKNILSFAHNTFLTKMDNAIVYTMIDDTYDTYVNQKGICTFGMEAVGRISFPIGFFDLSWSMYRVIRNNIEDYIVPNDERVTLGFAPHKITSRLSLNPFGSFFVTPSVIFLSKRWAITAVNEDEEGEEILSYRKISSDIQLDLTILQRNIITEGLSLSMSARNMLNRKNKYVQPYIGYEGHYPKSGAEFMLSLTYEYF